MSKNNVILITGASRGIGKYLVNHFLEKGLFVVGCARSRTKEINDKNYLYFPLDVTDEKEVIKTVRLIYKKLGRIDCLINSAGVASMNHSLMTPGETVDKIFDVNFKGTFFMCRECAKVMKMNKFGRIINLATVAVPMRIEGEAIYAASKSAVITFSRIFAKEVAPFNITCNCLGPSPIDTDLIKDVPKEKIARIVNGLSIKRKGNLKDVANAVDFFVSEKSDYITGQLIYLGGV